MGIFFAFVALFAWGIGDFLIQKNRFGRYSYRGRGPGFFS
jgi:hypothetical protein